MTKITVEESTYTLLRTRLTAAAEKLHAQRGTLSSAVPTLAFGPIGAFVPPIVNRLGANLEDAAATAADTAQTAATGAARARTEFAEADDTVKARMQSIDDGDEG